MRRQVLVEIMEGECQECGMIGPMIVHRDKKLCEVCEISFD